MLIVAWSCCDIWLSFVAGIFEGVKLFASVAPPAIEVSGTPTLRGGGGWGYSDEGWYAVAVCICRFADCRYGIDDEKLRMHCGHWRGALDGVANRKKVEEERANAAVERGRAMIVMEYIQESAVVTCSMECVVRMNGE